MPDPEPITAATWSDISDWLLAMSVYIVFVVTFAFSMLTALAIIPSLVSTGHLPARALKLRPPIVGFGLIALLAAASVMGLAIVGYMEFDDFYQRWWI